DVGIEIKERPISQARGLIRFVQNDSRYNSDDAQNSSKFIDWLEAIEPSNWRKNKIEYALNIVKAVVVFALLVLLAAFFLHTRLGIATMFALIIGACIYLLATLNSRAENVAIKAVVVFELAFRDVQRQIFAADFVIAADDAALELRPEALNRVRVHRADHVAMRGMIDGLVVVAIAEPVIDLTLIGRDQAHSVADSFLDELLGSVAVQLVEHAGNDVATTFDRANDWRLGNGTASFVRPIFPVLVLIFTTDECFVDFDDA